MKRGLALLSLLWMFNASAQIEVSSKKQETVFCTNMGLHCIVNVTVDTVSTYWLSFRDAAYKHIEVQKNLRFSSKEDLMTFYTYIVACIGSEESQVLSFNDQTVGLNYEMNLIKVTFEEGYFYVTSKQALKCIDALKSYKN
jgi:hypothetical protein